MSEEIAIAAADLAVVTQLRAALDAALAELDSSQPIVIAAARLLASIHGDGNGRCWCGAREADQLRAAFEQAGRV